MDTREFRTTADKIWDFILFSGCLLLFVGGAIMLGMLITKHLAAAGIMLIVNILLCALSHHALNRDDRRIKEKKQAYLDKYCSTVKVDGGELGELEFTKDTREDTLTLESERLEKHFSGGLQVIIEGVNSADMDAALRFIRRTIRDRELIADCLQQYVQEVYLDEGITEDNDGEHVDFDYIAKKMYYSWLWIVTDENGVSSASLIGGMDCNITDHIAEHGLTADFLDDGGYDIYSG